MVAIKNNNVATNSAGSSKSGFQEPEGMIEIDLQNATKSENVESKHKKYVNSCIFKLPKNLLMFTFYAFMMVISLIIIILLVWFTIAPNANASANLPYASSSVHVQRPHQLYIGFYQFMSNDRAHVKWEGKQNLEIKSSNLFDNVGPNEVVSKSIELQSTQDGKSSVIVDDFGSSEFFAKKSKREIAATTESAETSAINTLSTLPKFSTEFPSKEYSENIISYNTNTDGKEADKITTPVTTESITTTASANFGNFYNENHSETHSSAPITELPISTNLNDVTLSTTDFPFGVNSTTDYNKLTDPTRKITNSSTEPALLKDSPSTIKPIGTTLTAANPSNEIITINNLVESANIIETAGTTLRTTSLPITTIGPPVSTDSDIETTSLSSERESLGDVQTISEAINFTLTTSSPVTELAATNILGNSPDNIMEATSTSLKPMSLSELESLGDAQNIIKATPNTTVTPTADSTESTPKSSTPSSDDKFSVTVEVSRSASTFSLASTIRLSENDKSILTTTTSTTDKPTQFSESVDYFTSTELNKHFQEDELTTLASGLKEYSKSRFKPTPKSLNDPFYLANSFFSTVNNIKNMFEGKEYSSGDESSEQFKDTTADPSTITTDINTTEEPNTSLFDENVTESEFTKPDRSRFNTETSTKSPSDTSTTMSSQQATEYNLASIFKEYNDSRFKPTPKSLNDPFYLTNSFLSAVNNIKNMFEGKEYSSGEESSEQFNDTTTADPSTITTEINTTEEPTTSFEMDVAESRFAKPNRSRVITETSTKSPSDTSTMLSQQATKSVVLSNISSSNKGNFKENTSMAQLNTLADEFAKTFSNLIDNETAVMFQNSLKTQTTLQTTNLNQEDTSKFEMITKPTTTTSKIRVSKNEKFNEDNNKGHLEETSELENETSVMDRISKFIIESNTTTEIPYTTLDLATTFNDFIKKSTLKNINESLILPTDTEKPEITTNSTTHEVSSNGAENKLETAFTIGTKDVVSKEETIITSTTEAFKDTDSMTAFQSTSATPNETRSKVPHNSTQNQNNANSDETVASFTTPIVYHETLSSDDTAKTLHSDSQVRGSNITEQEEMSTDKRRSSSKKALSMPNTIASESTMFPNFPNENDIQFNAITHAPTTTNSANQKSQNDINTDDVSEKTDDETFIDSDISDSESSSYSGSQRERWSEQSALFEDTRVEDTDFTHASTTKNSANQKSQNDKNDDVSEKTDETFIDSDISDSARSSSYSGSQRERWSEQSALFKDTRTKDTDFTQGSNQVHTNQQSSVDFTSKPACPMGFTILQQANPYPVSYPTNPIIPYQGGMQYPLTMPPVNPYQFPYPYPYQSIPPVYVNPSMQQSPFHAQAVGQAGQYFVCSPLPNTFTNQFPDFEIRKRVENMNLQQRYNPDLSESEEMRESRSCPPDHLSCRDGSKCVKEIHFCNGEVDCKDASDELDCSCKARIDKSRICDGYYDCPDGEDELNCFGCDEDTFSCDDWSTQDRTSSCIPIEQRCDGIHQCPTGKDEESCSILTSILSPQQNFIVSSSVGFLYRNHKGKWYPACYNPELWANQACRVDAGPNPEPPLTHSVSVKVDYTGPYATMSRQGLTEIIPTCERNAAIYVECPQLACGTRITVENPYRSEEVDTSVEEILSRLSKIPKRPNHKVEDPLLGDQRVVGGKPCQPQAWPWIVSIYRNGVFHCGGVIINENWIVTAAHCVDKYWHYYYEVQAGVLRRYSYSPMVQNRMISNIISHQYYDRAKLKNDIALMKMEFPLQYSRYIRPACLPSEMTAGTNYKWNPKPGTICSAIGWGAMAEHGTDPDHLREVQVPVLKNCKHREDKEGHEICAGLAEGGKDACQGDSGGPFMCRNPDIPHQWYLAGVVSHGEGCARPNEPGVYTRVSLYIDWIYGNIRSRVLPHNLPLPHCPGYVCNGTKRCIPKKRHCDKIVDCLYADDEVGCDSNYFNELFKHAMRNMLFRSEQGGEANATFITNVDNEDDDDSSEEDEGFVLQQIAPNMEIGNETLNQEFFFCSQIFQTIAWSKKCDRKVDCEDASDEEGCTCVDYLNKSFPEAVCDGVADCRDSSDEQNCYSCGKNKFNCRLSNVCISNTKRCDGISDCALEEDEQDCFALTDGRTLELDADMRPVLNKSGIVTFNRRGTWQIVCDHKNVTNYYASHMCIYLGFSDYKKFLQMPLKNNSLEVVKNGLSIMNSQKFDDKCRALYVKCSDSIVKNVESISDMPWNAEIYINGTYKCMGALIELQWVVTSSTCFDEDFKLFEAYVAVLLGGHKTFLEVMGKYEEILRVVEYIHVPNTDISLLRLSRNATTSRYIQPIKFNFKRTFNVNRKEMCMAVGRDEKNQAKLIRIHSVDNCTEGYRCFQKSENLDTSCESQEPWSGYIVCHSTYEWYASAVFFNSLGACGFSKKTFYPSLQYWKGNILKNISQVAFVVDSPACSGFRCTLGECIDNQHLCNGVPDCRDALDENPKLCSERDNCTSTSSCVCKPSEMKCNNGKCVLKNKFCNKIDDCGDSSDEPDICNCKSYLKVTNPSKVCDGIRNCEDRSDEDPHSCPCSSGAFKCGESNYCVSQDVVCDQFSDCPNNEDELNCYGLIKTTPSAPLEVYTRTNGVWHAGCFSSRTTILELEDICYKMGYISGRAAKAHAYNQSMAKSDWGPSIDGFYKIALTDKNQKLVLGLRKGDKPFATLRPTKNCYRLFLNCL